MRCYSGSFVCLAMIATGNILQVFGAEPTRAEAVDALHRAVHFFRSSASIEGGYVFRWSSDLQLREGETRVGESTAWIEPPATPAVGQAYLDSYVLTQDELLLDAAEETAKALLRGQMVSGGWTEQIEFADVERKKYAYRVDSAEIGKRKNVTTFDDDKTQSCIRFLMKLDLQLSQKDQPLHEATIYALAAVLDSQYANGAWPQKYDQRQQVVNTLELQASYPKVWARVFPSVSYSEFYTLNDSTLIDLIQTLLEAADIYRDQRYLDAAKRGGEFLLRAQMPQPQPGWAQQYDSQMHPAWARKFEPPAISGGESQGVMRMLLQLYQRTGDDRYLQSVRTALAYYQRSRLPNGRLARFYELQTNRPLYLTKTYQLTYEDNDLPTHYAFTVSSSLGAIEKELQKLEQLAPGKPWVPKTPQPPKSSPELAQAAAKAIDDLDARGAWVESGKLKAHPDVAVDQIIASATFIKNLRTLSAFIASMPQ